jgi:hypothetical protein
VLPSPLIAKSSNSVIVLYISKYSRDVTANHSLIPNERLQNPCHLFPQTFL